MCGLMIGFAPYPILFRPIGAKRKCEFGNLFGWTVNWGQKHELTRKIGWVDSLDPMSRLIRSIESTQVIGGDFRGVGCSPYSITIVLLNFNYLYLITKEHERHEFHENFLTKTRKTLFHRSCALHIPCMSYHLYWWTSSPIVLINHPTSPWLMNYAKEKTLKNLSSLQNILLTSCIWMLTQISQITQISFEKNIKNTSSDWYLVPRCYVCFWFCLIINKLISPTLRNNHFALHAFQSSKKKH